MPQQKDGLVPYQEKRFEQIGKHAGPQNVAKTFSEPLFFYFFHPFNPVLSKPNGSTGRPPIRSAIFRAFGIMFVDEGAIQSSVVSSREVYTNENNCFGSEHFAPRAVLLCHGAGPRARYRFASGIGRNRGSFAMGGAGEQPPDDRRGVYQQSPLKSCSVVRRCDVAFPISF